MKMVLWKGRFDGEMSSLMKKLGNSLKVDIRLLPYDIKVNEAWAEELKSAGVISSEELKEIKTAFEKMLNEKIEYNESLSDEDVHSLVERLLTQEIGETGKKIHTGKSRNDQVVTDLKLYLKDRCVELETSLKKLASNTIAIAEENIDTIVAGYTHLQQAQPISLAHYLLSFAYSLLENLKRLASYTENNLALCPLGCGALAGTTVKIDRKRLAKNLGFEGPTQNSLQTVSDRAFVVELASTAAIASMHLSRYAEDLIIWNSSEFGFIKLSDAVSTGSSMMPQKKNPDSLEIIRGITGTTFGNLMGLLTITKGVPLSYAKDLQDDKKFIFSSLDITIDAINLFSEVLAGIEFDKERMINAIKDETLATDIADHYIEKGTPFREAHKIVGDAVKKATAEKKSLCEILPNEIKVSPESAISKRTATGGTSISSVREQLKYLEKKVT